ncbi:MAG: NADH:flavin oxidoreductase/NADH oxidase [Tepidisphaeraceae bacterium]
MSTLFTPFTQRSITFRNRIGISPMCQYSAVDGLPTDWHLVHLGSRAVGGAGMVMTEATAVEPIGRISPGDTGLWNDPQQQAWSRIAGFIAQHGAVPGMQIAHAGRKASTAAPWLGGHYLTAEQGGWQPVGASPIRFSAHYGEPVALTIPQIKDIQDRFVATAGRAVQAGFKVIELHAAHGYLFHSFLSPLSNQRTDEYGGSFDNRVRILIETATAVRAAVPDELPLWTRLSCTDWVEGGWTIEDSIELAKRLKQVGVDLIDCSSGGNVPRAPIPSTPGYQVPFAAQIRSRADIATAAVGLITGAHQAAEVIDRGDADLVLVARQSLRDAYWPLHAAKELQAKEQTQPPLQYERAF